MTRTRRRKCRHCGQLYDPDPRNRYHQRFCGQPVCRRASQAASQRRWRASPKGEGYFRGSANRLRVKAWQRVHPGYPKLDTSDRFSGCFDVSVGRGVAGEGFFVIQAAVVTTYFLPDG